MPTAAGQALLDSFERIRIINLEFRVDRRREIAAELARLGLSIDGQRIAFHPASRPADAKEFPSVGARGCFESHLAVLSDALEANASNVLILEDDCEFAPDAGRRLPAILAKLKSTDWSIFFGGYALEAPTQNLGNGLTQAEPDLSIGLTHFCAFSRNAVELAVPYLISMASRRGGDPQGGPMHVDGAYNWLRRTQPELQTWIAMPEVAHQRPSISDIAGPSAIDRIPGLRAFAPMLRAAKRSFRAIAGRGRGVW